MSPALIAILKGGLGNQLFGYAAARALALRSGRRLYLDASSGFARDGYGRRFRLDRFGIDAPPCPATLTLGDPKSPRHRIFRVADRLLPPPWRAYLKEPPDRAAERLASFHSRRRIIYLNGYWQDEACFRDAADILRAELEPPPSGHPDLEREFERTDSVFLHVRRIRYSPRLDADYYRSAIRAASEALGDARFEVFGDDPEWAENHLDFLGKSVRFHPSGEDELIDFRLMTCCRHAIVANSSFSWWAAWLRKNGQLTWTPATPGWPLRPASGWTPVANRLDRDPPP